MQTVLLVCFILKTPRHSKVTLFGNLLNWSFLRRCIIERKRKAYTSHRGFLLYCSFWLQIAPMCFNLVIGLDNVGK